jgi:hypothetical protein
LSKQVGTGMNEIQQTPPLTSIIKERKETALLLNVHISVVYFNATSISFYINYDYLIIIGSFCVEKHVLKRWLHHLVTSSWTCNECLHGFRRNSGLLKPMCQLHRSMYRSMLYNVCASVGSL